MLTIRKKKKGKTALTQTNSHTHPQMLRAIREHSTTSAQKKMTINKLKRKARDKYTIQRGIAYGRFLLDSFNL